MTGTLLVLNGPNLNMLGARDPAQYGTQTLGDIEQAVRLRAAEAGLEPEFAQSNHEGELIDLIHAAHGRVAGLVINPGGLTHTSVALRDALEILTCPMIEVHLSNVHAREEFRRHSYVSPVVTGVIAGLGAQGYLLAVDAIAARLRD